MLRILIAVTLLAIAAAQTDSASTVHPHRTHHPNPNHHDNFGFFYMQHSGVLIMMSHSHCYMLGLSAAEKTHMHNPLQREMIEVNMAALVADKTKQTAVDVKSLDAATAHHCLHRTPVKLSH